MAKKRTAFTLIEILVVVGIIALLAALLLPAFNRVRERGRQAHCATNLHQISIAVQQYYQDEKRYPNELRDLLPNDALLDNGIPPSYPVNQGGLDYFKGGSGALICPSDDFDSTAPRSSYGNLSVLAPAAETSRDGFNAGALTTDDPGRYVWNYWGYDNEGVAFETANEAKVAPDAALVAGVGSTYNQRTMTGFVATSPENVMKYSLSNRYAPPQTIVTHCVFHRPWTAANTDFPGEIYTTPSRGQNARDVVLRLDGTAKLLDVSAWNATPSQWQQPAF